jgi:potassium voltage-gated channel Shab-related subfamily B protein 1
MDYWQIPREAISECCHTKLPDKDDHIGSSTAVNVDSSSSMPDDEALAKQFELLCCPKTRIVLYKFLEEPTSSIPAKIFAAFSISMIIASFVIMVLQSMEQFCKRSDIKPQINTSEYHTQAAYREAYAAERARLIAEDDCSASPILNRLNEFVVYWFTVELVVRFIVAPRKLQFIRSALNIIDVIAILPFYIELVMEMANMGGASLGIWSQLLLSMRSLRVLRVLKLARYSTGLRKFGHVLHKSKMQLLTAGITAVVVIMVSSTMMYYAERNVEDTKYINIPTSMWWALVTMSSVGYGDVVPETNSKLIILCHTDCNLFSGTCNCRVYDTYGCHGACVAR